MTSRNTSEHTGRDIDEHSDEDPGGSKQTRYPGADQKPAWIETDTTVNFVERIRGLDSNLAHNIDQRLDITMESRARMEVVIDSLSSIQFENASENINSVSDVTKAIFQPIHDHMEYSNEQGANRQEWTLDERLGRAELRYRQNMFELALRCSRDDPSGRDRYSAEMDQAVYEPLSYPKESDDAYVDKLLDWLKEKNAYFGEQVIQEIVENKMSETDKVYQEQKNTSFRAEGSPFTIAAASRQLGENLWEAVKRNDRESFKEILDEFPERDRNLAQEIRENAGFTNIPPGERPDFTQELTTLAQKEEFVTQINYIAGNFNTPEYIPNPDMRNALENQVNEINRTLEVDVSFGGKNIQNEHPQSTETADMDYYFRQETEALRYITRPRDPEFWKILDQPDEAIQDAMIGKLIQESTQDALELINSIHDRPDRPREAALAAYSAMDHVCAMNIKSDLIDQDLPGYKENLEDIQGRSSQFALAVSDGTGFIESDRYQEPVFPQWADQAGSYIAAVNDKLQELNLAEEIETDHYKAITHMLDRYTQTTHKIIMIDMSDQGEEYRNIATERGDLLRGIQILMRPRE